MRTFPLLLVFSVFLNFQLLAQRGDPCAWYYTGTRPTIYHETVWSSDGIFSPTIAPSGSNSGEPALFTGTNHVLIPLWTAKTQSLDIPISLSNIASGIRLQQIASCVGLGWNLNYGGCIRRTINGLPDDIYSMSPDKVGWVCNLTQAIGKPCSRIGNFDINSPASWPELKAILGPDEHTDTEPDLFFFDSPFLSGSFLFSNTTDPTTHLPSIKFINQSNTIVDVQYEDINNWNWTIKSFIVTDQNGNKFYFNDTNSDVKETFSSYAYYQNHNYSLQEGYFNASFSYSSSEQSHYTTAWFLTKIVTYLNETITFEYAKEEYLADPYITEYSRGEESPGIPRQPYKDHISAILNANALNKDKVSTWRITNISGPTFKIDFIGINDRQDLVNAYTYQYRTKSIDRINVYSKTSTTSFSKIRQFDLSFFYNISTITSNAIVNVPSADYRLMLKSVQESLNSLTYPPYEFYYIPGDLPNRLAYATDIFGYYNGGNGNTSFLPELYINTGLSGNQRFDFLENTGNVHGGANRQPNSETILYGTLDKIHFPSGSVIQYIYEPHQFAWKGAEVSGGGLRLKQIKVFPDEESSVPEIKAIEYLGGKPSGMPKFGYYDPTTNPYNGIITEDYLLQNYIRTSSNLCRLGFSVGYDNVIIHHENGSKSEYNFENKPNDMDPTTGVFSSFEVPVSHKFRQVVNNTPVNDWDLDTLNDSYPYGQPVNTDWFKGRINSIKEYDALNNLVKKVYYHYTQRYLNSSPDLGHPDEDCVYGMCVGFLENHSVSTHPIAIAQKYKIFTGVIDIPDRVISTEMHQGDSLTVITDFFYNKYNQQSRSVVSNLSDGTKRFANAKYVLDYFDVKDSNASQNYSGMPANMILQLAKDNVVHSTVEVTSGFIPTTSNIDYITGGQLTEYNIVDMSTPPYSKWLPYKLYSLQTANPLTTDTNTNGHFITSHISTSGNDFICDPRYKLKSTLTKYDGMGRLCSINKEGGNTSTMAWDQFCNKIICSATNATENETGYAGFEWGRANGWSLTSDCDVVKTPLAFAGNYLLELIPPYGTVSKTFDISSVAQMHEGFQASIWAKPSGSGSIYLLIEALNNNQVVISQGSYINGPQTSWQYSSVKILKLQWQQTSFDQIRVRISGDGLIDEVKFCPVDAILNTSSYDETMNLLAESGTNDTYHFYEYDDLGRLIRSRDQDKNILTTSEYNFGSPALFSIVESDPSDGGIQQGENIAIVPNKVGVTASYTLSVFRSDNSNYKPDEQNYTGVFQPFSFSSPGSYKIKLQFSEKSTSPGIAYEKTVQVY